MEWVTEFHGSLAAFTDTVESRVEKYDSRDDGWYRSSNTGHAVQIARQGWGEVRPLVDQHRTAIMAKVRELVTLEVTPEFNLWGSAVDMGEYMTGNPECMIDFPLDPNPSVRRSLRLVMDPGGYQGVSADELAHRGAAVATLLEVLQMIGYSLEVFIASPVTGVIQGSVYTPIIQANSAGELVDVDALMFACGHPSMLRRMIFTERLQHRANMGTSVALDVGALGLSDIDVVVQRAEHRNVAAGEPDAGRDGVGWVLWALQSLGVTPP